MTERGSTFTTRPISARRNCRAHEGVDLALPEPRCSANERQLPNGRAARPKPFDLLRLSQRVTVFFAFRPANIISMQLHVERIEPADVWHGDIALRLFGLPSGLATGSTHPVPIDETAIAPLDLTSHRHTGVAVQVPPQFIRTTRRTVVVTGSTY
jgi:hypothetical protein